MIIVLILSLLFDCATASTHKHDRLRDADLVIASWSGCTITGTIDGAPVTLYMDVASCPLHAKVPGKVRVRYDQTCGAVLEMTDGPVITTPMPVSCPSPTPLPTPTSSPSPLPTPTTSGVKGVFILESDGTRWSLGSNLETLRNGIQAGGGYGSVYKVVDSVVYVLGMDGDWYRWSSGWSWFSKTEPGTAATPTPTPTPTVTPIPRPSPSPSPTPKPCKWWQPWKCL